MKFVLVGPGIMPIPPPGWGAVEILIWEYYQELKRQGHDVVIVNPLRGSPYDQHPNTLYSRLLIQEINYHCGDVVHIHYDCLHYLIPSLTCRCIFISSHFPYIGNTSQYGGYDSIFHALCQNDTHFLCAISKKDYDVFKTFSLHPEKVLYTPNGTAPILPLDRPGLYLDKSIYIGKVEPRKKQNVYKCLPNLDFYGKCEDKTFRSLPCYKGEMEHGALMLLLREYGSLVLLSDGESDPLVLKEALMAGLPIVTTHNMPYLPFVFRIPDDRLEDMDYIQEILEKSRVPCQGVREYASQFSWEKVVKDYILLCKSIV
jgi:glycosyltransferase involved in cell wall biosynthesis